MLLRKFSQPRRLADRLLLRFGPQMVTLHDYVHSLRLHVPRKLPDEGNALRKVPNSFCQQLEEPLEIRLTGGVQLVRSLPYTGLVVNRVVWNSCCCTGANEGVEIWAANSTVLRLRGRSRRHRQSDGVAKATGRVAGMIGIDDMAARREVQGCLSVSRRCNAWPVDQEATSSSGIEQYSREQWT